ncbi:MAG: SLOG family protein [Acidithiobacillus sp.]|nr:SLOG family protein [Acidithiobacillus sp.]
MDAETGNSAQAHHRGTGRRGFCVWRAEAINLSQFVESAIFVFGSNRQGIHGAGAARFAQQYRGAQSGTGEGLTGQSYALPTKHTPHDPVLDLALLQESVARFLDFAESRPWLTFLVTRVGCGLAGFTDAQVAPLFAQAPTNCHLPGIWQQNHFPLIVAGSRGISEAETILHLDEQIPDYRGPVVSGMAQGVDTVAVQWAKAHGVLLVEAPALWNRYGRAAGPIRNQWMSWYATHLLALWDGESRGTHNMIETARRDKLEMRVVLG